MRKPFNMNIIPLSKSSISLYKQCPYRFYLQYIKQIPFKPSEAMVAGLKFHREAQVVYDKMDKESILKGEIDIQEHMKNLLPDDALFEKFIIMETKKYTKLKREDKLKIFFPIHRELFIRNNEYIYNGIVDRVDELSDGNYAVVDYKTGKLSKYAMEGYEFELLGYKMLIDTKKLLYKPVRRGCIVFPKELRVKWFDFPDKTPESFYKIILDTRKKIRRKEFDRKEGVLCGWCPYEEECING